MSTRKPGWIVGIDVGGTFTDLIMLNADDATVRLAKVPTTMHNQAYGVVAALAAAGAVLAELQVIVHGTTTTDAIAQLGGKLLYDSVTRLI